jgi:ribosomal protein S18 acetylase RimI-like enzyme
MIANPPRESYLAIRETEVAGFIVINMTGAFVGYIQSICVAEQWRSQGIGTTLIHYAEARIFQEVPNASICASSFNSQARSLYERLGYSLVGELKDFVVTGHSEFLLRKTIGSLTEWQRSIPHPD